MNKNIKKFFGIFLLLAILFFVGTSLLAIWDYVGKDVVWRSLSSIVVLGLTALLSFGILNFIEIEKK
jgi:hypothetical protein